MATETRSPTTSNVWPARLARARRVDGSAAATWALTGGLMLYLGLGGGGYDILVRSRAGLVVWWIVLIGAVFALLPAGRLSRTAWVAMALFAGLVAWTGLSGIWSLSSERSLQELSRVAAYLGILVLALTIHRDRQSAARHTIPAVAAAIAILAVLALVSRLFPHVFPAARTTAAFLPGTQARLGWPLNYWNALAALVALGLAPVLAVATSARTLVAQAAAAAVIPLLALCEYLTFSRGGAIAAVVAVVAFVALAPQRLPKLATLLVVSAGGAVLIAAAARRHAIEHGLAGPTAVAQGHQLALWCLVVCVAVAVGQAGVALARRRWPGGWLHVSRGRARILLAAVTVGLLVAGLAAGGPSRLDHAWQQFKSPNSAALSQDSFARYGALSGEGRYDYWRVALNATSSRRLQGSGAGTFQLLWQPRAPFPGYLVNAHSLYVETLAEIGVVGLALLAGFLGLVLGAAVIVVTRSGNEGRTLAAGATAGLFAFAVSAIADWVWQVPVLPAAVLLLAAAMLAPARWQARPPRSGLLFRGGLGLAALVCLVAIAIPFGTASAVRQSQAASAAGYTATALADAQSAARLEPGAASPQLQEALVLELRHELPAAVAAAHRASQDEPSNWQPWFVLARVEAESGHARAAVQAYRRARLDNPRSAIFQ